MVSLKLKMAGLEAEMENNGTDQAEFPSLSLIDGSIDFQNSGDAEIPQARPRAALAFMDVMDIVAASFGENGRRCYKVQWKDSWVYEDHLFDCNDLIEQFWKQQPENREKRNLRKRNADGKVKVSGKDTKDLTVIVMSDNATNNTNNCSVNIETELMLGDEGVDDEMGENKDFDWHQNTEIKRKHIQRKRDVIVCHLCGEEFDMVAAVRRHYSDNHPGAKPFACDSCGKRFDRKENLSRHVRIHTGDRRYICNYCGKGYTDPSGLKKHVISKHSNINFPCEVCGMNFKTKDSLNRHLTKHLTDFKSRNDIEQAKPDVELLQNSSKGSQENMQALQDAANVQQLQQYAGTSTVQVQYIQVTHDPSGGQSEEDTTEEDLNKSENGNKCEDESNFVAIPIVSQVLSLQTPLNVPITTQQLVTSVPDSQHITFPQNSVEFTSESATTSKSDTVTVNGILKE
ncbi:transcription factor Ouib-like [Hydractinia symbiolongicarpus]|uniref:transcription factor Ouib-like n=1 Tax=Hydractinia symbiolongicarpus TaxID=13093 RepID=UPI00254CE21A|nr:transcription factor Ouib-like [Hydractinia symbiolongicarpus]